MSKKECVAMVLAGGHGKRLSILTKDIAKPAVPFGAKYRIIDFTLSNCCHSRIDTVGVLTQYEPLILHDHIGAIKVPGLVLQNGGLSILPPFQKEGGGEWYKGTANAVCQNIDYINRYEPAYVLVLSGDHVYKMDYRQILRYHKEKRAMATVAVMEVPWNEAGRFGILNTKGDCKIQEFEEKPEVPRNNLASMGIYVFNWPVLKAYLLADEQDHASSHDFGKDVLPRMLREGVNMYAYPFTGYWRDIGTVDSLWRANMDLLGAEPLFDLHDPQWPIYTVDSLHPPHFLAHTAKTRQTLIGEGCLIYGEVYNSVLFAGVYVAPGAIVKNSVILPKAKIGSGAQVDTAIIGNDAVIEENSQVGYAQSAKVTVVSGNAFIPRDTRMCDQELCRMG